MDKYMPRIVDSTLEERLSCTGAVLIQGPKWCGKTTTAERVARSEVKLQDPDRNRAYLTTARVQPSLLLRGENPRLIDEWQMAPALWDAVRCAVDERGEEGLFILTGSTSVDESAIMHSGTGRISRLTMYPMSLYESGESNGKISLKTLFDDPETETGGVTSDLTIDGLVFAACRGGWPSSLKKKTDRAQLYEAYDYIENICASDASTVDGVKKSPSRVRAILASYARNVSTLASDRTLLADVGANFGDVSAPTLDGYLSALERLFVVEDVPAWCPRIRSAGAMRASKKRGLTDPSVAVAAEALTPDVLIRDLETFGFIFESLCIRDLRIYSAAMGGRVSYYRDKNGLEADCALHLNDGRYALIECKLGSDEIEKGARHLTKLRDLVKAAGEESRPMREPDLLIVLTGGREAYDRPDGVKVIPIGCLRD